MENRVQISTKVACVDFALIPLRNAQTNLFLQPRDSSMLLLLCNASDRVYLILNLQRIRAYIHVTELVIVQGILLTPVIEFRPANLPRFSNINSIWPHYLGFPFLIHQRLPSKFRIYSMHRFNRKIPQNLTKYLARSPTRKHFKLVRL